MGMYRSIFSQGLGIALILKIRCEKAKVSGEKFAYPFWRESWVDLANVISLGEIPGDFDRITNMIRRIRVDG